MTAERRYSARHPMDLPVQILYGKRRFCGARACNLSRQGIYLSPQNLTLPVGTLVELELFCLGQEWRVDAVVIHRDAGGIGVMFRTPQEALYQGLLQGLTSDTPQGRGSWTPHPQAQSRPLLARH